ncbi:MAG: CHAT domain-containing protein [Ardenticatenales bacterium]|nr:CHAT domain-containing protein [Ardenticatenales bacterium]
MRVAVGKLGALTVLITASKGSPTGRIVVTAPGDATAVGDIELGAAGSGVGQRAAGGGDAGDGGVGGRVTAGASDDVKAIGRALFERLLPVGDVRDLYERTLAGHDGLALRLRIDGDGAAALLSEPWELLYDPARGRFLATHGPFVRQLLGLDGPSAPLAVSPPLRVLVVLAEQPDLPRLQGEAEAGHIAAALRRLVSRRHVVLTTFTAASLEALEAKLAAERDAGRSVHVVHFVGHGAVSPTDGRVALALRRRERDGDGDGSGERRGDSGAERGGIGGIDNFGAAGGDTDSAPDALDAGLVTGAQLAGALEPFKNDLKLVFLSACFSAAPPTTAARLSNWLARDVLALGIPCVIGMPTTVPDGLAVRFARRFYGALARGRGVDAALNDVRRQTVVFDGGAGDLAQLPICYLRADDGRIIAWTGDDRPWTLRSVVPKLADRVPRATLWFASTVAAVFVAAGLSRAWAGSWLSRIVDPQPMRAHLGIAVAAFDGPAEAARSVAQAVYDDVRAVVNADEAAGVDACGRFLEWRACVRPPEAVGRAQSAAAEGWLAGLASPPAETLARRIAARVVVYGRVSEDARSLQPYFYIDPLLLPGAEEMAGRFELGPPVSQEGSDPRSPEFQVQLARRVRPRIEALLIAFKGLACATVHDVVCAKEHLAAAAGLAEHWPAGQGRDVIELWLGNLALRLGRLDEAEAHFRASLADNASYTRADLGLAEVVYQRAHAGCSAARADLAGLARARAAFARAEAAVEEPPEARSRLKASYGLARVDFCVSRTGIEDRWAAADAELATVIDTAGPTMVELAALAHGIRAYVHALRTDDPALLRAERLALARAEIEAGCDLVRGVNSAICGHLQLALAGLLTRAEPTAAALARAEATRLAPTPLATEATGASGASGASGAAETRTGGATGIITGSAAGDTP